MLIWCEKEKQSKIDRIIKSKVKVFFIRVWLKVQICSSSWNKNMLISYCFFMPKLVKMCMTPCKWRKVSKVFQCFGWNSVKTLILSKKRKNRREIHQIQSKYIHESLMYWQCITITVLLSLTEFRSWFSFKFNTFSPFNGRFWPQYLP